MAGEVYALNHLAVWTYMDKYEIKNQTTVFEKVIWLFYKLLEISRLNKGN